DREAVIGQSVADATIILAAVDPCYCCTERMAAVDADSGKRVWSSAELIRLSQQKTEMLKKEIGTEGPKFDLGAIV
ncbi:MAG: hypothetical protein Q8O57_02215, partial [Kiritimatiellota bacterium]|nr:hypothetical protein [Kiritimatiellota bacterium]